MSVSSVYQSVNLSFCFKRFIFYSWRQPSPPTTITREETRMREFFPLRFFSYCCCFLLPKCVVTFILCAKITFACLLHPFPLHSSPSSLHRTTFMTHSWFLFDSRVRSFLSVLFHCFSNFNPKDDDVLCPFLIFFSLPLDSFLVFRGSTATFSLCFVDVTRGMTCHVLYRETESCASQERSQDTLSNNKQRSEKKRETTKRHDSEKMEGKVTWQEKLTSKWDMGLMLCWWWQTLRNVNVKSRKTSYSWYEHHDGLSCLSLPLCLTPLAIASSSSSCLEHTVDWISMTSLIIWVTDFHPLPETTFPEKALAKKMKGGKITLCHVVAVLCSFSSRCRWWYKHLTQQLDYDYILLVYTASYRDRGERENERKREGLRRGNHHRQ